MSDVIRKFARALGAAEPPKPVAGYLPAPKQARFVSRAEEAAQRLPANIKAQSVPNQLQKFGAKPIELEYAGLGDFLKGKDKVSSQDALAHLQQQGPLGQLKRVDQGDSPHRPMPSPLHTPANPDPHPDGGWLQQAEEIAATFEQDQHPAFIDNDNFAPPQALQVQHPSRWGDRSPPKPTNFYQSDVRAPFGSDRRGSFPDTGYASYTVPGQQGDFTGYREVLLEDPKARKGGAGMLDGDTSLRGLPLPEEQLSEMNAQLKQFDQGGNEEEYRAFVQTAQALGLHLNYAPDGTPYFSETRPNNKAPVDAHRSDYWLRYNNLPDRIAIQNVQSDIGQKKDPAANSPLARDNNWKNLMLRHALLESVNQGGKPITLPTGQQMVDVEGFGTGGKGSDADPAGKADRFNEDLASRLLKAFKEIHPQGATMTRGAVGENALDHQIKPLTTQAAMDQDQSFRDSLVSGLLENRGRGSSGMSIEQAEEIVGAYHHGVENEMGYTPEQVRQAELLVDGTNDTVRLINDPKWARHGGDLDPGSDYWKAMTPKERDAVMKMVQYDLLMEETGMEPMNLVGENAIKNRENKAFDPGWTIKPHPETVRAALEKGVPIMSIAPFLLQQSLMSQQEESK